MEIARRQRWSRPVLRYVAALSDWIRHARREAARVRASATEADWDALGRAAWLETTAAWAEAELNDALARGPLA
jgi:hypothetical protein